MNIEIQKRIKQFLPGYTVIDFSDIILLTEEQITSFISKMFDVGKHRLVFLYKKQNNHIYFDVIVGSLNEKKSGLHTSPMDNINFIMYNKDNMQYYYINNITNISKSKILKFVGYGYDEYICKICTNNISNLQFNSTCVQCGEFVCNECLIKIIKNKNNWKCPFCKNENKYEYVTK